MSGIDSPLELSVPNQSNSAYWTRRFRDLAIHIEPSLGLASVCASNVPYHFVGALPQVPGEFKFDHISKLAGQLWLLNTRLRIVPESCMSSFEHPSNMILGLSSSSVSVFLWFTRPLFASIEPNLRLLMENFKVVFVPERHHLTAFEIWLERANTLWREQVERGCLESVRDIFVCGLLFLGLIIHLNPLFIAQQIDCPEFRDAQYELIALEPDTVRHLSSDLPKSTLWRADPEGRFRNIFDGTFLEPFTGPAPSEVRPGPTDLLNPLLVTVKAAEVFKRFVGAREQQMYYIPPGGPDLPFRDLDILEILPESAQFREPFFEATASQAKASDIESDELEQFQIGRPWGDGPLLPPIGFADG